MHAPTLLRRGPRQLAGGFHLAPQPFWRDIKAVWPRWRAKFEKDAGKIGRVPQRFEYRARFVHHRGEVVHAIAAVVEPDTQPEAAELFETCHLGQHRDLR